MVLFKNNYNWLLFHKEDGWAICRNFEARSRNLGVRNSKAFITFSRGLEMKHWRKMGQNIHTIAQNVAALYLCWSNTTNRFIRLCILSSTYAMFSFPKAETIPTIAFCHITTFPRSPRGTSPCAILLCKEEKFIHIYIIQSINVDHLKKERYRGFSTRLLKLIFFPLDITSSKHKTFYFELIYNLRAL